MTLTLVKNRLQDDFAAITGVTKAYDDLPQMSPFTPDLPAVIMARRKPFIVPRGIAADRIRYTYQFDILFLYKAIGQDTIDAWDSGIEPYPQRFYEKLCADILGGGVWTLWNKDDGSASFDFGIIEYAGGRYFGFRWSLDIWDEINTTMSVGS